MELVRQRTNDQCAIASIVMATGLDYDYVLNVATIARSYIQGTHTASLLNELNVGFRAVYDHGQRFGISVWRDFLYGRRAVLSVESLNNEGGKHLVFWDGYKVLDPQNGNTFDGVEKKFFTEISDNMVIETAYLICECGCSTNMTPLYKIEKLCMN
jgi:hypothetical protein